MTTGKEGERGPSVHRVPYGDEAFRLLGRLIGEAQADDPLAPVTVAVPHRYAELYLRRSLAAGEHRPPGSRPGLANVRFVPLSRIARTLGVPALIAAGRRPAARVVVASAIRTTLNETAAVAGVFAPVADHPSTEASLVRLFEELDGAPVALTSVLQMHGEPTASAVRLFESAKGFLTRSGFFTEADLMDAAIETAGAAGIPSQGAADLGTVIVFLPRAFSEPERRLLDALAGANQAVDGANGEQGANGPAPPPVSVIAGTVGNSLPDRTEVRVMSAPDPDEEVRTVLRTVLSRLEAGVPLHETAILYSTADPYRLILHDQLRGAGIPFFGPSGRKLADSLAGRCLTGLLNLCMGAVDAESVIAWLSGSPIRRRDATPIPESVPVAAWEAVARHAGKPPGTMSWTGWLRRDAQRARHRAGYVAQSEDAEAGGEEENPGAGASAFALRDMADQADDLAGFVERLCQDLKPARSLKSWTDLSQWARDLLDAYLLLDPVVSGPTIATHGTGLHGAREVAALEAAAQERVHAAVSELALLDEVDPHPSVERFARRLLVELQDGAGHIGETGKGILVGPVSAAYGTARRLTCVLGMSEGSMPRPVPPDPFVPDHFRRDGLTRPGRREAVARQKEELLAVLASSQSVVLSFPRRAPFDGAPSYPSAWLLDLVSTLHGHRIGPSDVTGAHDFPWLTVVGDFLESGAVHESASLQEFDIRCLRSLRHSGKGDPYEHFLLVQEPSLARAGGAIVARRRWSFTGWDGRVESDRIAIPGLMSSSRLHSYAECPFRYFLGSVLEVEEREEASEWRLDAGEKGRIVHEILERLYRGYLGGGAAGGAAAAAAGAADHVDEVADAVFGERRRWNDDLPDVLWRAETEAIREKVRLYVERDEAAREERGVQVAGVEISFDGSSTSSNDMLCRAPVIGGVTFRGRIDRIDRHRDGSLEVIDYKTGNPAAYRAIAEDPIAGGTYVQLGVYALACTRPGSALPEVSLHFLAGDDESKDITCTIGPAEVAELEQAVATLAAGIGGGLFPAHPGERISRRASTGPGSGSGDSPPLDVPTFENCTYCAYDAICPVRRDRTWDRVREDDSLAGLIELIEGVPDEDDDD